MAGYNWDPVVRIVPRNGSERVLVFADEFSDLSGHERADVRYVQDIRSRRDVNRVERPVPFGWRPEVRFDLSIMTMADQHALAEIQDALMSSKVDVYLAMDSCTFRRVVLASDDGPDPLAGKPFVGAKFRLGLRCAELIHERPRMGETTNPYQREFLQDGWFEQWVDATNAQAWAESTAGGTVDREASIIRTGTYAAELNRSGAGDLGISQSFDGMLAGLWYRLLFYTQLASASASTTIARCELKNSTKSKWISSDGQTWADASGTHCVRGASTLSSWTAHTIDFRVSTDFRSDDSYNCKFLHGDASAILGLAYDDASLVGPILPTGVSLW